MPTRSIVLSDYQEAEDKAPLNALRYATHIDIEDVEAGRVHDFSSTRDVRSHLDSLTQRTLARNRAQ